MQFNFEIDTLWCLDHLVQAERIFERDKIRIQSTQRTKEQLHWHPLQWIASFLVEDRKSKQPLTQANLSQWLADQAGLTLYRINPLKANVSALTSVMSQEFAQRNRILAVETHPDRVLIATDQPFLTDWITNLSQSLAPKRIERVMLAPEQLQRYLIEYYEVSRAVNAAQAQGLYQSEIKGIEALLHLGPTQSQSPDANDQHIVKLVDWLLQFAFEQRASDIHLEPRKETSKLRFRIDGVLHTIYQMPTNTLSAVIARIKILGRLNVAEKRKPQDGRLKTRTPHGQETELRLSTLPTAFGEKLVMRIFDPEVLIRSFDALGFDADLYVKWHEITQQRHGIVLVTGPTGSGKTTTLYSSLKTLATDQVNVCTIEDPIEMIETQFNQMQVNSAIELGFAQGIKALMRQDPDIIMVGEIRDHETAHMAIQAALTGHLVLSTLHTNDAPSSLIRLHDLGVAPFLTAATVLGVLAQRLVRTLCSHCKQAVAVEPIAWQQLTHGYSIDLPEEIYAANGCEQCRHTGYKGRIGLYEFMPLTPMLKRVLNEDVRLDQLKEQAKQQGVEPLRIAAARKVGLGLTSLDEVLRIVPLN